MNILFCRNMLGALWTAVALVVLAAPGLASSHDDHFDANLHFLRTCPPLIFKEITSYLDQTRIGALYNAEVIPDSSADYKRNAIRRRLKPLLIKKIEDCAIEKALPFDACLHTLRLMRMEVKDCILSEILDRKASGVLINVYDIWASEEVVDYFRARAFIGFIPDDETTLPLDRFSNLRTIPWCQRLAKGFKTAHLTGNNHLSFIAIPNLRRLTITPMGLYIDESPDLLSVSGLSECETLKSITIFSPLRALNDLPQMLRSLHLNGTFLTSLKYLKDLNFLKVLTISDTSLTSLKGIEELPALKTIDLDLPLLKSLKYLRTLPKLKWVHLRELPNVRNRRSVVKELRRKGCAVDDRSEEQYMYEDF